MKSRTKLILYSLLSIIFIIWLIFDCNKRIYGDVYAPADSVVLTVGVLDTTFLAVDDPDSVWFKWWRDVGGQTIVDSAKVTTALRTGFVRHKIKASDGSNNLGTYIAEAVVYNQTKTGIKTWAWTVKAEFDAILDSLTILQDSLNILIGNAYILQDSLNQCLSLCYTAQESLNVVSIFINDILFADLKKYIEPQLNGLNLYVTADGDDDSSGLTWIAACSSISAAESKCAGYDEYFIHVAPGSYVGGVTFNVNYTHVIGSGMQNCFWSLTGGASAAVLSANGCEITGFTLTGGSDCVVGTGNYSDIHNNRMLPTNDGILLSAGSYHNVYDNYITIGGTFGIVVYCDRNFIYNNYIDSIGNNEIGISLGASAQTNLVARNIIKATGTGNGILNSSGSSDNLIVDNYVWAATPANAFPLSYSATNCYLGNHARSYIEPDSATTIEKDIVKGRRPQAESTYVKFTEGSNEDQFKATGFAVAGDAMTLTPAERGHVEDSIYANKDDYKATDFATSESLKTVQDSLNILLGDYYVLQDSVNVILNNKGLFKATGFGTSDSLKILQDSLNALLGNAYILQDSLNVVLSLCYTAQDSLDIINGLLRNATYGLSALEGLVDDLESRLTSTRADYLDNLNHALPDSATTEDSLNALLGSIYAVAESIDMKLSDVGGLISADRDTLNKILEKIYAVQDSLDIQLPLTYTAQESLNVLLGYFPITSVDSVRKVYLVDSLDQTVSVGSIDSIRKVYIVDSLDQTVAAEVDTEAVARSVWNDDIAPPANRIVTASCEGSGANTVIIYTRSSVDSTGISGFKVDIEDSINGEFQRNNLTKSAGACTVNLDNGHYQIALFKTPYYTITSPVYCNLISDTTLTYYATPFVAGSPPSAEFCLVYGWVDTSGVPISGAKVAAKINYYPLKFGDLLLNPYVRYATTDSTGYWELNLYINSLLTPDDTKYQMWIFIPAGNLFYSDTISVPDQENWEFTY